MRKSCGIRNRDTRLSHRPYHLCTPAIVILPFDRDRFMPLLTRLTYKTYQLSQLRFPALFYHSVDALLEGDVSVLRAIFT